jgi:hypothetical protein
MKPALWITFGVLGFFLVLGLLFLYVGWTEYPESSQQMSTTGYVAMAFGVVATLALGIGLMWLMFHSSRTGRD